MNDEEILEDEDDELSKLTPQVKKGGDVLDEDPESIDELIEEEEEEEEPFDDVDPL